jgi:hypothetical protein
MLLSEWLQAQHAENERLSVAEGLCDTLHNAQATGTLRGELGPDRLDLSSDGVCEILPAGSAPPALLYRAPEARSGGSPGPTSSVYSAGVILYEILAGKPPKEGEGGSPAPLRSVRRDLPAELADAVMACLEKDPDWRPKDVSYVLQMVRRLRGGAPPQPVGRSTRPPAGRSTVAPRPAAGRSTLSPLSLGNQPLASYTAVRRRGGRSGPPIWALALAAIVVVGIGGFLWLRANGSLEGLVPSSTAKPSAVPSSAPTPAPTQVAQATTPPTPIVGAANPTPVPSATATPLAALIPTPEVTPTPMPVLAATPTPLPTPVPVRATPTPPPTPVPTATPTPTPRPTPPPPPATLENMAPRSMARGSTNLYDLHGTNIRNGLRAVVFKGNDLIAPGVTVVRQKVASATRLQIVVKVDANVEPGDYSVVLVDETGQATNRVKFQIPK